MNKLEKENNRLKAILAIAIGVIVVFTIAIGIEQLVLFNQELAVTNAVTETVNSLVH